MALGVEGRGAESSSGELMPGQWLGGQGQSCVCSWNGEYLSQAGGLMFRTGSRHRQLGVMGCHGASPAHG